jgi:hypothetical protein
MKVFWIECGPGGNNFGDMFTKYALDKLYGIEAVRTESSQAQLVGSGSVVQLLDPNFSGHVVGTGAIHTGHFKLPHATIHSVRGPHTAFTLGLDKPSLGDIGVLAGIFQPPQSEPEFELGIVPHYVDDTLRRRYPYAHVISTQQPVDVVLYEISRCSEIVSSSLHGLIVADSMGIPSAEADGAGRDTTGL